MSEARIATYTPYPLKMAQKKWEFKTGHHVDQAVTVVNDSIYVPNEGNRMYSIVEPFSNR